MTKKEMMYEIISNTKICGLSEKRVNALIAKISKERVEEVYEYYKKDPTPQRAYFCYCVL